MRVTITTALAVAFSLAFNSTTFASAHQQPAPQQWRTWSQPQPAVAVVKHRASPHHSHLSGENKLRAELSDLRHEINDLKQKIGPRAWAGVSIPFVHLDVMTYALASLPDLRQPEQEPALPVLAPSNHDKSIVDEAMAYLKRTATPGYTMLKQGLDVALGRLHPAFVVRLADGIRWAREHGLPRVGVYSAYRPPAFGVGGFGNKFFSMHSYGLAADITGIGSAGTSGARIWEKAVQVAGIYLPYGPNNRAEYNHVQLIGSKMAWLALRRTITGDGPKDLVSMWKTSGVTAYLDDSKPVNRASLSLDGGRK